MPKVIKFPKPKPLICEACGDPAIELNEVDIFFYCKECTKMLERALAVKEMDADQ